MLRVAILHWLTLDIECIDTLCGVHEFASKRQIAEAIASAMDDDLIEAMEHGSGTYLGGYGRATPTPTVDEIENDSYPPGR